MEVPRDGFLLLELSTRCPADDALRVSARIADTMRALASTWSGPQKAKTRLTLDCFMRRRAY